MGLSNYIPSSRISQSGVCTSSTRPATPYEGQVIYETDTNRTLVWNNSAWVMPNQNTSNPGGMEMTFGSTVSGTSAASVNNCFNNTNYKHFRVIASSVNTTVTQDVRIKMRANGSDKTGQYYNTYIIGPGTVGSVSETRDDFRALYTNANTSYYSFIIMDILNPYVSTATNIWIWTCGWDGSSVMNRSIVGFLDDSVLYDGFSLVGSSGTISANVSVYGYRGAM